MEISDQSGLGQAIIRERVKRKEAVGHVPFEVREMNQVRVGMEVRAWFRSVERLFAE